MLDFQMANECVEKSCYINVALWVSKRLQKWQKQTYESEKKFIMHLCGIFKQ